MTQCGHSMCDDDECFVREPSAPDPRDNEISRLRAALAASEARTAAAYEDAAKRCEDYAPYSVQAIKEATISQLVNSALSVEKARTAHHLASVARSLATDSERDALRRFEAGAIRRAAEFIAGEAHTMSEIRAGHHSAPAVLVRAYLALVAQAEALENADVQQL